MTQHRDDRPTHHIGNTILVVMMDMADASPLDSSMYKMPRTRPHQVRAGANQLHRGVDGAGTSVAHDQSYHPHRVGRTRVSTGTRGLRCEINLHPGRAGRLNRRTGVLHAFLRRSKNDMAIIIYQNCFTAFQKICNRFNIKPFQAPVFKHMLFRYLRGYIYRFIALYNKCGCISMVE